MTEDVGHAPMYSAGREASRARRAKLDQRDERRRGEWPARLKCPVCQVSWLAFKGGGQALRYDCLNCRFTCRIPVAQIDRASIRAALGLPKVPR